MQSHVFKRNLFIYFGKCLCMCVHICMHACPCVFICARTCVCLCVCMYCAHVCICLYTCLCVFLYLHMHVYICAYVCVHTHVHHGVCGEVKRQLAAISLFLTPWGPGDETQIGRLGGKPPDPVIHIILIEFLLCRDVRP